MATKQTSTKKTSKISVETVAAPVAPARVTKPRAPRVTTVRHSKATTAEPAIEKAVKAPEATAENPQEAIATIAYGYWVARGYQGGNPAEDWLRAEAEYLQQVA